MQWKNQWVTPYLNRRESKASFQRFPFWKSNQLLAVFNFNKGNLSCAWWEKNSSTFKFWRRKNGIKSKLFANKRNSRGNYTLTKSGSFWRRKSCIFLQFKFTQKKFQGPENQGSFFFLNACSFHSINQHIDGSGVGVWILVLSTKGSIKILLSRGQTMKLMLELILHSLPSIPNRQGWCEYFFHFSHRFGEEMFALDYNLSFLLLLLPLFLKAI